MRKLNERELAVSLVAELQSRGYVAVFAGGCVRDELMGRKPKDYDIATSALPDEVIAILGRGNVCGKSFGVVKVRRGGPQGPEFDIATLRADGNYSDGRHPEEVRLGVSLREDAERRDFTMNAMFLDPLTGEIFDFFGGREDIACGVIRAVGNPHDRIREDRLRMLRAPRFAARYGFSVDPELMAAIQMDAGELNMHVLDEEPKVFKTARQWLREFEDLYAPFPAKRRHGMMASLEAVLSGPPHPDFAHKGGPQPRRSVSFERIKSELEGTLTSKFPVVGLDLLVESGLLDEVLPELSDVVTSSTWERVRDVVSRLAGSSFELLLAGLVHSLPLHKVESICRRLKLDNKETASVRAFLVMLTVVSTSDQMTRAQLVELCERTDITELIALQDAVAMSWVGAVLSRKSFLLRKLDELKAAPLETMRPGAKPVVTGDVLIAMSFKPGPAFKQILEDALTAQREGVFSRLEEAKQWVVDRFGPRPAAPATEG
jgi:tRNA nucleotidyltransferase/poly(A) polymerase